MPKPVTLSTLRRPAPRDRRSRGAVDLDGALIALLFVAQAAAAALGVAETIAAPAASEPIVLAAHVHTAP